MIEFFTSNLTKPIALLIAWQPPVIGMYAVAIRKGNWNHYDGDNRTLERRRNIRCAARIGKQKQLRTYGDRRVEARATEHCTDASARRECVRYATNGLWKLRHFSRLAVLCHGSAFSTFSLFFW